MIADDVPSKASLALPGKVFIDKLVGFSNLLIFMHQAWKVKPFGIRDVGENFYAHVMSQLR